ncbi:MAG TPA: succinyldiaminopimelate transaminase [Gammaproteobacteria bacterium]|nr:succinyldiaminopimelate transaminase [Gammaproteobacteria bacterium]
MNPDIALLKPYPFERLGLLLAGITAPADRAPISLSIGEPRHAPPAFVVEALARHAGELGSYPTARGFPELRKAMGEALARRYRLGSAALDPDRQILPVSGTREGLFSFVQAVVSRRNDPLVVMPNPFYQIYEGAALLAGVRPWFLNTTAATGQKPDLAAVPEKIWNHCALLFLCSPGNPGGAILDANEWKQAFQLADRYGFLIAADECYADLYTDDSRPPPGALETALALGRDDFRRLVVFHSLSKRSSVPGLRSGLAAGDAAVIEPFARYRTYHGCAMPIAAQRASIAAWNDDDYVAANRRRYQTKFAAAKRILAPVLPVEIPPGAFYLWLAVPGGDDERFARELYRAEGLVTLPGRYLSRPTPEGDPGAGYLRVSLVPEEPICEEALHRLARFARSYES